MCVLPRVETKIFVSVFSRKKLTKSFENFRFRENFRFCERFRENFRFRESFREK
jgi:hypothetical protein